MHRSTGVIIAISALLAGLVVHSIESSSERGRKASKQPADTASRMQWMPAQRVDKLSERKSPSAPASDRSPSASTPAAAPDEGTPEKLSAEQQLDLVRLQNGQLFRELGLTDEQVAAVTPLLAQRKARVDAMQTTARKRDPETAKPVPVSPEELDSLKRIGADIAATIGADKAERLRQLQRTVPSRVAIDRLRNELALAGEPITDDQQRELINRMSDRQPSRPSSAEDAARELDAQRRQALADVLTPRQLELSDRIPGLNSTSHDSAAGINERATAGAAAPSAAP